MTVHRLEPLRNPAQPLHHRLVSGCCRTAQADLREAGRDADAMVARAWLVMSPAR